MNVKLMRIAASCLTTVYECIVYFLSFALPVLVIYHFRSLPILLLLVLCYIGFSFAGLVFLLLLVLTKRFLIGSLPTGDISVASKDGQRWFLAAVIMAVLYRSPFHSMTVGISLFAQMFFRGMGARMPDSTFLGQEVLIRDPWFLEMGEHVSTGSGVLFLGHIGHNKELFLGKVVIGDDVVIGIRTIIFPDVHIGNHVRIGAGAVVVRGTRIPDGETWVGVPARKLQHSDQHVLP